jgi:2,3-bisphosphoglycerate-dependent phosphoglycerate mutase
MSHLILVRHGTSEWNKLGLWTGKADPDLAKEGVEEALKTGILLKDIKIDFGFSSAQKRAINTLTNILSSLSIKIDREESANLNERDYGIYTGKNKWEIKEQVGDEEFKKIRRGWDTKIPEGESLKSVYERVIPYYKEKILPKIQSEKNVIVVSSGNALRSLVKYIENMDEEGIANLEFGLAEAYCYKLDKDGKIISKEIRSSNPNKGKI